MTAPALEANIETTVDELKMLKDSPLLWSGIRGAMKGMFETGRISILQDFDSVCMADAFIGFSDDEWKAVKKFFALNKEISGWDK